MTDAELRARVRDLMTSGVLPREPAPIQRPVPPPPLQGPKNRRMFLGDSLLKEPCTICGKLAPQVQHFTSTWVDSSCASMRRVTRSGNRSVKMPHSKVVSTRGQIPRERHSR